MKTVKKTAEYTVLQRGDGRYAVRGKDRKWVNGEAKVDILVKEELLNKPISKPKPEPAPETNGETAAEETAAEESGADTASAAEAGGEAEGEA
jgi:hypothetical protein